MVKHGKWAAFALAGLATLSALGGTAFAIEIGNSAGNAAVIGQMRDADLQTLRNQIQRQQFQQQQQLNREQDRRIAPPPVLDVPKVKPACQTQVFGNSYLRSCR
ncbi:MAG: hypothetical protein WBG88_17270 [Mesorhizobium sp.]